MRLGFLLLFLLFAGAAFAQCSGYHEIFDVQVLDAKQRPIEGAMVNLTYDRGTSFGEQYFTIENKLTDKDGKVHYDLLNQGTTTRKIDCKIVINATIEGTKISKTIEAGKHGPIVDVIFTNVYPVRVYVRDQYNAPLVGASVAIGSLTADTNEDGYVKHYLKTGKYDYFANYLEARESGNFTVADDVDYQVTFAHYKISVDVMDDASAPLDAVLTMNNQTFNVTNGHFENPRSFGEEIPYIVEYKGLIRTGTLVPQVSSRAQVVFDIHAPLIVDMDTDLSKQRAKLVVTVSDQGDFPSGVDLTKAIVRYRLEPADPTTPWNNAVVFPTGVDMFTAEFSELPANRVVQFVVEVKDKAGNRASVDGKFSTLKVNGNGNTQNQTNTHNGDSEPQELPLIYIIGGLILIILTIYLGIRIKSLKTEGI